MLIKNSFLDKKVKVIYLAVLILGLSLFVLLAILGGRQRTGYITEFSPFNLVEINDNTMDKDVTSNLYEYRMRIKYYSKVFRNSDIFGVYPQNLELPSYINNIEWDGKGSPFGKLTSSKELVADYVIDIEYKLKLKYGVILYFVLLIVFISLIIVAFIYLTKIPKKYKINNNLVKNTYSKVPNQIFDGFSNIRLLYIIPIVFYPILILLNQVGIVVPYYFAWDSSSLYATDSLLINGGLIPLHLFHPDIGALWVEKFFVFPIAKFLGIVSISTIQEFQNSLNPYFNFVEVTEFLLLLRASYIYVACSLVYIFIIKLFEDTLSKFSVLYKAIFIFVAFLFSYNNATITFFTLKTVTRMLFRGIIRYEFAGILWWSLGLLAMLYAAKTNRKRYIVAMGIFCGWAFISKIVLLPIIILTVLLYYVLHLLYSRDRNEIIHCSYKERKLSVKLSFLLLIIVIASLSVVLTLFNKGLLNSAFISSVKARHLSILASIFPLFLLIQSLIAFFLFKFKDRFNSLAFYVHRLIIFTFSCYIPMIVILFQKEGIKIFSNVYVFSFALGQISMSLSTGYNESSSRITSNGSILILVLSILFLIGGILFYIYSYKKTKKLLPLSAGITMLGAIMLLNRAFLRGNESNLPFYSIFICIFVLVLILYKYFSEKKIAKYALIIFLVLISFNQANKIIKSRKSTNVLSNSSYTFNMPHWYSWSYSGAEGLYPKTIRETYKNETNWNKSFYWTRDIANVKGLLRSVQGAPNQLENTSIIFADSKLSKNGDVLKQASQELEGAISIPMTSGSIYPRLDYNFYLVSSNILENKEGLLELTDLLFESVEHGKLYVYEFIKPDAMDYNWNWAYSIKESDSIKYLLITDFLAIEVLSKK